MTKLPPINELMSPPEAKSLDSFTITPVKSPTASLAPNYQPHSTFGPIAGPSSPDTKMGVLASPPESPAILNKRQKKEQDGQKSSALVGQWTGAIRDPQLYEDSQSSGSFNGEPLFPPDADEIISKHEAMHMAQFSTKVNRPTREEYRLALALKSHVGRLYNQNPGAYLKRQREENDHLYHQTKRLCAGPGARPAPVYIAPAPKQIKRAIVRATPSKAPIPRVKRTPKASPITKLMNFPVKGRSETPDRLPGTKREDVDYTSLPDYTPPTSTLPSGNPKILKADWPSNNILNLSNDPDRHMLHEAEINLAGTLRLNCATYLCSKRRIFEARLNALRIGKEFRKTDAQQACKIDVNKASKLWTAFDKVGWFNKELFQQYL